MYVQTTTAPIHKKMKKSRMQKKMKMSPPTEIKPHDDADDAGLPPPPPNASSWLSSMYFMAYAHLHRSCTPPYHHQQRPATSLSLRLKRFKALYLKQRTIGCPGSLMTNDDKLTVMSDLVDHACCFLLLLQQQQQPMPPNASSSAS